MRQIGRNPCRHFLLAALSCAALALLGPGAAGSQPVDSTLAAPKNPSFFERHKTATTLLAIEAVGAGLASSGYIAEAIDQPPSKGAEFTGATYLTTGSLGVAFAMIWATDPELTTAGRWAWIVALGGLIGLGAYDLSLKEKNPTSQQIFRDNMIGINAVVATTAATKWFVGRRSAPRP